MNKTIKFVLVAIIIVLIGTMIILNLATVEDIRVAMIITFGLTESILVIILLHCYSIAERISSITFNLELANYQMDNDRLKIAELEAKIRNLRRNTIKE